MESTGQLSKEDIIFLRAVRDINADPDSYVDTEESEMPANKLSIQRATDLTSYQVEYRLTDRGFKKDEMGLLLVYDPIQIDKGVYAPKSAELTQKGIKVLSEVNERGIFSGGTSKDSQDERLNQLRSRVDALEKQGVNGGDRVGSSESDLSEIKTQIEQLESQLESIENDLATLQDVVGASDWDEFADDLRRIRKLTPAMMYSLDELLALDIFELVENPNPNSETKEEMRAQVLNTLQKAHPDGRAVSESNPDQA